MACGAANGITYRRCSLTGKTGSVEPAPAFPVETVRPPVRGRHDMGPRLRGIGADLVEGLDVRAVEGEEEGCASFMARGRGRL